MQISIIGDLHLEFDGDLKFTNQSRKQVVVLAGDIQQGIEGMRFDASRNKRRIRNTLP